MPRDFYWFKAEPVSTCEENLFASAIRFLTQTYYFVFLELFKLIYLFLRLMESHHPGLLVYWVKSPARTAAGFC